MYLLDPEAAQHGWQHLRKKAEPFSFGMSVARLALPFTPRFCHALLNIFLRMPNSGMCNAFRAQIKTCEYTAFDTKYLGHVRNYRYMFTIAMHAVLIAILRGR